MRACSRRSGSLLVCLLLAAYGCGGNGSGNKTDAAADGVLAEGGADVHADGVTGDRNDARTDGADGAGDAADGARDVAADGATDGATDGSVDVAAPTCTDGIKNGDETGTDCGGRCGKCAAGNPCKVAADCQFEICRTDGTCGECIGAGDCPGVESECQHRTCTAGVCGAAMETAGKVLDVQTAGDCKRRQCSTDGKVSVVNDDTDLPDDKNACTNDVCTAGVTSHTMVAANTSCGGANHCDANGQCVGCSVASECPGTDTPCRTRTCSAAGVCGVSFTAQGTKQSDPTAMDCKGMACDGNGNSAVVNDDTDLPVDGNACTTDECNSGTPSHQPVASGTACGGTQVCDGASKCVECLSAASCPGTDTECHSRSCISGVCGIKNQPVGTPLVGQTLKDCKKNQCDGLGAPVTVSDDTDLPVDNNPCTSDVCTVGMPSNPPVASRTTCGSASLCDGQGACVSCLTAADCPGTDNECHTRTCSPTGVCGVNNTAAGTAAFTQMSGDCKKNQCDGAGAIVTVADDTDKPVDGNACTSDVCASGVSSNPPLASGTACGPSLLCNGNGACVGCVTASDCPGTDTACQTRTCVNNMCGVSNAPMTTVLTTGQMAGDCKKDQCDGAGHVVSVADDTDKPDDGNACTSDVCTLGVPSNPPVTAGTACVQGGGSRCNGLASGTGIGPACVQCLVATDCNGSDTECRVRSCSAAGVCGTTNTTNGTAVAAQLAGDCKKNVCNNGAIASINDDTDPQVDGNACTRDVCASGVASNPPESAGTACNQNGGTQCNGSGSGPRCVVCLTASQCPGSDTACHTRTCTNGACGVSNTANNTLVTVAPAGDCQRSVCDGNGNIVNVADNADLPTVANQCVTGTCTVGVPTSTPRPADTSCSQSGGTLCDGAGTCVQCNIASTCPGTDTECQQRACAGGTCGFNNTPINTPVASQTPNDCQANVCDGNGGTTTAPDNADFPVSDGNACHQNTCASGAPSYPPVTTGTACGAGGLSFCDATGTCVACLSDANCDSSGDPVCAKTHCVSGACTLVPELPGVAAGDPTVGDCQTNVCDGIGGFSSTANDTDVPNDGKQCTADSCINGVPTYSPLSHGTSCTDGGGRTCDGAGSCLLTFSVVRVGDGSAALMNTSTAGFVEERRIDGALIAVTTLPATASGSNLAIGFSGTATSDGGLSLSSDGRYLTLGGYNQAPGTGSGSVSGSSASTVKRVVARIAATSAVDTSTQLGGVAFTGNNIRSVTSNDGSTFWAAGNGGIFTATVGATTSAQLLLSSASPVATLTNVRWAHVFGGQLYATSDRAADPSLCTVGNPPPPVGGGGTPVTVTALPGMPANVGAQGSVNVSPFSFVLFDRDLTPGFDVAYVADDGTNGTKVSGGIQKWTLSGATWTLVSTSTPSPLLGFRGLAGLITVDGNVTMVGTTAEDTGPNRLFKIVDNGSTITFTQIATVPTNEVFRGVALSPHL